MMGITPTTSALSGGQNLSDVSSKLDGLTYVISLLCRVLDYVDWSATACREVHISQWLVPCTEERLRGIILGAFAAQNEANGLHLCPLRY
jgi:hypothetical protein